MRTEIVYTYRVAMLMCVSAAITSSACERAAPTSSVVARVNSKNAQLDRATAIAQARLDEFIAVLQDHELEKHGFTILTHFTTPDGESVDIWVGAEAFADDQFTGIVDDKPEEVTTIKLGDTVTIARGDVFDWMYLDHDTLVGGWTVRVQIDFAEPGQRDLMMERLNLTESDLVLPPVPEPILPQGAPDE